MIITQNPNPTFLNRMANLDFCDKHNMVAFLKKPEGSEGFHQIVDFLNSTHINTSENGEMEITATIDERVKTVTEASIRRHLKLKDSYGISTLPNTEIFKQLALMGYGEGSTVPVESYHTPTSTPSTLQPPTLPPSMQTTCVVEEAATMPHDSPLPRVHLLRSDEGSMTLHELIVLCTILSNKVESLESDLKQTKLTYGAAYTKLIIKGRHEHDLEPNFDFTAPEEVYTAEPNISTTNVPVSIVGAKVSTIILEVKIDVESLVYIKRSAAKRKDKGKAIMKEVEPVQKKTKMQLEQERLGYEEALRLQEQLDEEERQRIDKVHEEANTFNAEEWDNIQAQIEADEELAQKLQAEERGKFSEAEKARLLVEMINET
ncbi:hypothetical protein Tco_1149592 [Tanacetum coccineum]